MRISVECGGYAEAASVCRTANHVAALLTESLAGKLHGYAAMAGDDATSSDFSAAYDPAAREAVGALADLTHALIGLGRLVDLSGLAHARAEAEAAGTRTNAYTGGPDADAFVRVSPDLPPSSLGGSVATGLGDVHAWILDQVEGFVWPGADVDRLRDAAGSWRRTGGSVADLTGHLDAVTRLLDRQLSPEIPIALSAIVDLRSLVEDTADQLLALADACDDYAAAVEDTRARTRSLLAEIGQMIVEEVALTAIVAGITGGLGGRRQGGCRPRPHPRPGAALPRPPHRPAHGRRDRRLAAPDRRGPAGASARRVRKVRPGAGAGRARGDGATTGMGRSEG